jgi:hypothetical protein
MRIYLYVLTALTVILASGCATKIDQQQLTAMKSSHEGVALINVTVNAYTPNAVQVVVVQADASGKFAYNNAFNLRQSLFFGQGRKKEPAQLRVAAGTYGIFEVRSGNKQYRARASQSNLLISIAEKPIAAFTVHSGEVVDVGTLHVLDMPPGTAGPSQFSAHVGTMPEDRLQNLSDSNPELVSARIQRTMTRPGSPGSM